jgi:hypothetical protein
MQAKDLTDNYQVLDINRLSREGLLVHEEWTFLNYTSGETDQEADLAIRAVVNGVQVVYALARPNGDLEYCQYEIATDVTRCNYGSARTWFLCPVCGRRAAKLYLKRNFLCRACLNLGYQTQVESKPDRLLTKAQKIREKIGGNEPSRPEGMHVRTFDKLLDKVVETETSALSSFLENNDSPVAKELLVQILLKLLEDSGAPDKE